MKALLAKIMEDVCLCTRKTVMCAYAAMGSLEFTVRKVRYDKTHPLSFLSKGVIAIVKYKVAAHAGVSRGAGSSSLPTKTSSPKNAYVGG